VLSRGLLVRIEAKPGKESEVLHLLMRGLYVVGREAGTPLWFAMRLGHSTFAVFDAFANEDARQAHLDGDGLKVLVERADELFVAPPSVEEADIPGYKLGLERAWEVLDDAG
jgi:quinol monooxygenase YgiN